MFSKLPAACGNLKKLLSSLDSSRLRERVSSYIKHINKRERIMINEEQVQQQKQEQPPQLQKHDSPPVVAEQHQRSHSLASQEESSRRRTLTNLLSAQMPPKRPSVALPDFSELPTTSSYIAPPRWKSVLAGLTRRCWSINVVLLIVLALALLLTAMGIWMVNFFVSKEGVNKVARMGRQFLLNRVTDHIKRYFNAGPRMLQSLVKEIEWADRYGLNISDPSSQSGRKALIALQASYIKYSHLDGTWFATEGDHFTGIISEVRGSKYKLITSDGDGVKVERPISLKTFNTGAAVESDSFSPTSRSWYKIVKLSREMRWEGPYISTLSPKVFLSVGIPFYDVKNTSFIGVISVNVNLDSMATFLKMIPSIEGARIVVLEPNLDIIASSEGESFLNQNNQTVRVNAFNHSDSLIVETAKHIQTRFGIPLDPGDGIEFEFLDSSKKKRIVDIEKHKDSYGIDWIVMLIIPEAVVLKNVNEATRISLAISGTSVACTIIFALIVGCIITRPLGLISRQMKKIANMDFSKVKNITSFGLYEIDHILRSMHQMQSGLSNFERFVPSDVVRALVHQKCSAKLGVVTRDLTVLFAEIKSSDASMGNLSPKILVKILTHYFTTLSDIIATESGVIDKYMGESLMALFNAPVTVADHPLRAVTAATRMLTKMEELNKMWKRKQYPCFYIIVGINSATCLVGNIGCLNRVSYTALGDGVNVASRLKSLNEKYKTRVIIGPTTYLSVRDHFVCRWLSRSCVKGKSEPLHMYEVLSDIEHATEEQIQLSQLHDQLRRMLESGNHEQATQIARSLLEKDENNVAARDISEEELQ